jgi:ADP-dependent NAD(P)H-hydrate dehydratase / NAD(P)H-hydrate epimerase
MQPSDQGTVAARGVPLYDAAGCRELDRLALADAALAGDLLMARAGQAAFASLRVAWPAVAHIGVLLGAGNNAGDGYVVAALAREAGLAVSLVAVAATASLPPAAESARCRCLALGLVASTWGGALPEGPECWVDALFGTGLSRALAGDHAAAIVALNASGLPVLALDLPSGLDADTGAVRGVAVQATATVTFIAHKPGLHTGRGRALCGHLSLADLGVPEAILAAVDPAARLLGYADLAPLLMPRRRDAHKGSFGHVLVVGGDVGFGGAARLTAEAALRTGAGLVSLATHPAHVTAALSARPELMTRPVAEPAELEALLPGATVVALGPGLGRGLWGCRLFERLLAVAGPLVLDADGLNLLAREPRRRDDWVLTPHPGEAARLLGVATAEVEQDRLAAADRLVAQYGGCVVLKGAGTVVAAAGSRAIVSGGNPGMASGGMGDVLTGVIAGLLAQGLPALFAASLGVALHARAGDEAALAGERGLLAGDLLPCIRRFANPGC